MMNKTMAPHPKEQPLIGHNKSSSSTSPDTQDDCPRTPDQPLTDPVSVEFTPRQNVADFTLSNLERGENRATPNRPRVLNRKTLIEEIEEAAQTNNNSASTSRKILAANDGELPRLVLRNMPFDQSANKVHIRHNKKGCQIYTLLKHNWFHAVLRWPTSRSLTALMSIWTGAILLFATLYVLYDNVEPSKSCGLGVENEPIKFGGAFAFSLETCTTVGYGLPNSVNSFFDPSCGTLQFIIYLQMAWSMVFNAFLLAFLYARLGRSESRANQVLWSSKALVSCINGQIRFQVRLFDVDAKHPVVEAHVRFYCVMKHRPVPRPLRMLQPDDERGGMLFLSFPFVVSHHIDLYSMLHPAFIDCPMEPAGLLLRQADATSGSRDDVICPVCGESFGSFRAWKSHARYQQIVEANEDYPVQGTHLSLNLPEIERQTPLQPTEDLDELKKHFEANVSEIICVVEGIDPIQSGTFQALQSYRYEDIVWDTHSQFAPCLTVVNSYPVPEYSRMKPRIFQVDLDRYHDIVKDKEAERAAAANPKPAATKLPTMPFAIPSKTTRHRRVKTSSRRIGDSLFSESISPPGAKKTAEQTTTGLPTLDVGSGETNQVQSVPVPVMPNLAKEE